MKALTIAIDNQVYPVLCLPGRPKALLDRTIAEIYEVGTREVNQALKNNPAKFPPDFYFELNLKEARMLSESKFFDLIWSGGHFPKAYSPLGCNMLATILKSDIAIIRSVEIIRAFTALESASIAFASPPEDVLQMVAAQSRMITVLAEEMYSNRRKIEAYSRQINTLDARVYHLENRELTIPDNNNTISSVQAGILREIVKRKGQNRQQISKIWFAFKAHFDLTRYSHLPKAKFEEACQWLKNWNPDVLP